MTAYTITKTSITVVINGKTYTVNRGNAQAKKIIDLVSAVSIDEPALKQALDMALSINLYSNGFIRIGKDGTVVHAGETLPPVLARRVFDCYNDGVPFGYLLNHFNRLNMNPSKRAKEETYTFLEHMAMPITPQGFFLGYKGVRDDYMDKWSGKFCNRPGSVLRMPRNAVCDDPDVGCSQGFHVGSLGYAKQWAGPGGRIVIVLVDPADVVSVPKDSSFQKLRTCCYRVVADYQGQLSDSAIESPDDPYATQFQSDSDPGDPDPDEDMTLDVEIDACYDEGYYLGADTARHSLDPMSLEELQAQNIGNVVSLSAYIRGYYAGYRGE